LRRCLYRVRRRFGRARRYSIGPLGCGLRDASREIGYHLRTVIL